MYSANNISEDRYYSRGNPRYGKTESFPPPRAFQNPPRMRSTARPTPAAPAASSALLRRSYIAEAHNTRKRRIFSAPSKRVKRRVGAAMLLAVTVTLLFAGLNRFVFADNAFTLLNTPSATENISTPRSEWRAGAMPFLYQTDPEWGDIPYAGGTIAKNGCGPTCLAMVYVQLTGRTDKGPAEMAEYSRLAGFVEGDATSWALMTEGAAELGLHGEEVPADATRVAALLREGTPIICSVRPGDFTTVGHFIVLAGLDDAGRAVVHDPNSAERSSQTWDIQRVLDQCRNLWAFS